MQHRIFRRAIVAMGALALVGCNVHDDEPTVTRNVTNVVLQLNATNAANHTTEILDGLTFTGIPGSVLATNSVPANTALASQTVSLKFDDIDKADGKFTLTGTGLTASGTVHFASCTFTVTTSSNTTTIPVGTVITIQNCSITINAASVPVGDEDGVNGTITLNLNGVSSSTTTVRVILRDDGVLIIRNGDGDEIITVVVVSGSTGG